jgi:hypothetical protein
MESEEERRQLAASFWEFFRKRVGDWKLGEGSRSQPEHGDPIPQIYYFLADRFAQKLGSESLLAHLQEKFSDRWESRIKASYEQAAPFWNPLYSSYSQAVRDNLQHDPTLVGYGEHPINRWSDIVNRILAERDVSAVNSKNRHEMLFLRTSHGLPLFSLRTVYEVLEITYEDMQREWEEAKSGSTAIPLHIDRRWERKLKPIEPQKPRTKKAKKSKRKRKKTS